MDVSSDRHGMVEVGQSAVGVGHGKVILLGEHAVLYGAHAIACPWQNLITAKATAFTGPGLLIRIPKWQIHQVILPGMMCTNPMLQLLAMVVKAMGLSHRPCCLSFEPLCPRASGVGGSAALIVAAIRALAARFALKWSDADVNRLAYEAETVAHGQASGIDNTIATYGQTCLYTRRHGQRLTGFALPKSMGLLIVFSGLPGLTKPMVEQVALRHAQQPEQTGAIFTRIDELALAGLEALQASQLLAFGQMMQENHRLLQQLGVSCQQLDTLVAQALEAGALGAKLTGGGGGGAVVLLCHKGQKARIAEQFVQQGYQVHAYSVASAGAASQQLSSSQA